ncbi:hypothetical protein ACFOKF_12370 [Sphingobium rhizovicinum]|uniref:DUF5678 domain-containing protein n=1 Tax=Sphingobium rhizovicinum TaxID=432308 RepID=A0ABV7NEN4_9SPHN
MVDGMASGTGVRDAVAGGYLTLTTLPLTPSLLADIEQWRSHYRKAHHVGFIDNQVVTLLDADGLELAERLASELPGTKVGYFSDARAKVIQHPI